MRESTEAERRECCDICGFELIALRRPTRTTYYCARKDDAEHRHVRRQRREAARIAEIERHINRR